MLYPRVWLCGVAIVWVFMLIGTNGQITHPAEVTALKSIKESLIDPNRNLSNWNKGDPCQSNWTGVLCFDTIMNDGYLHVRELQLLNMDLSGTLSPELGRLSYMQILDVMWNKISGSIPKEIGNITTLELMLLNGNQLTGSLPEEIGFLPKLDRIQIDQNQISGPLPITFANLNKTKHFHMNNNSISGQIPPELAKLPSLVHMLLDNNNLSGYLPPELANLPSLLIMQLDNNNFDGSTIPDTYGNMSHLLKLSLRNCGLQGPMPDLSRIQNLSYIDLSSNNLNGTIPPHQLSTNITTIDLSNNNFTGTIPRNFSRLPRLQRLSLENNSLSGSVDSSIWINRPSNYAERLIVDLQNNRLTNISGSTNLPPNVTVRLEGNPICSTTQLDQFCVFQNESLSTMMRLTSNEVNCPVQACPPPYEYSPKSPVPCFCAAPLLAGYRLKSPGFSDFLPYVDTFDFYLTSGLKLNINQLDLDNFIWEEGPRLKMNLKFFPVYSDNTSYLFNKSEVLRIRSMFTGWMIPDSDLFGPYELINFTLGGPYKDVIPSSSSSGISKGALAGIVVGTLSGAILLSALVSLLIARLYARKRRDISKRRKSSKTSIKIDGVRGFAYEEMSTATSNFDVSSEVGQGGYGKVYRGILADGMAVAIKRAQEGSLQGEKEFLTEIELLSRLHHRNLVSLVGYCEDEGEQMLVYEFMSNGTIREHLSGKSKEPLSFAMRLRIALGSAKGILYLHSEADPPIFHRDIKATNILLDSNYNAKVADFGLSRLAPVPDTEGIIPAHVSTVVKGTPGYLDPQYFLTHQLTDKSDVYSLGVVFLELLTGLHPISHGKNLVREVNIAYETGNIYSVIDDKMGAYSSECVEKFVSLALKCCKDEADYRPSMAEVVREIDIICAMMPDFKKRGGGSSAALDSGKAFTPSSSSSQMKNPYVSSDISGSELVSGVIPSISPR